MQTGTLACGAFAVSKVSDGKGLSNEIKTESPRLRSNILFSKAHGELVPGRASAGTLPTGDGQGP